MKLHTQPLRPSWIQLSKLTCFANETVRTSAAKSSALFALGSARAPRVQSVLFNFRLTSISFNQKQLAFDAMEAERRERQTCNLGASSEPTEVKTITNMTRGSSKRYLPRTESHIANPLPQRTIAGRPILCFSRSFDAKCSRLKSSARFYIIEVFSPRIWRSRRTLSPQLAAEI